MIQTRTRLTVADNSGAQSVMCIKVLVDLSADMQISVILLKLP